MANLTDLSNALLALDEERGDLAAVCGALARAIELDDDVWDSVSDAGVEHLNRLTAVLKQLARD